MTIATISEERLARFLDPNVDAQRFLKYVAPMNDDRGCWEWYGALDTSGYGQFHVGGKRGRVVRSSRVAWSVFVGSLPDGQCVCHRCDNRTCVNPDHLFLGSQEENRRDMIAKGRQARTARAESVPCPSGHTDWRYETKTNRHVGRRCRPCQNEARAARRLEAAAATFRRRMFEESLAFLGRLIDAGATA